MLNRIIQLSLKNKLLVLLFVFILAGYGVYALFQIPIGAVPDVTNNQVQVITTSKNLSTQDVEQFITYPIELEMANLPGVKEIRSISKFGLSVVTIVFEDDLGSFIPRQLIAEKLKTVEEKIPAEFGVPQMGPITTGLGEVYQYTLEVDAANKSNYSLADLRTIQDWQVKRQLSGIKGVIEVNTWGGYLKQYQVTISPERLRSQQISVQQIFNALESNNSSSGGGYIEKTNETYFIRGEGKIESIEDIEQTVVVNRDGTPVLIRDVATVEFGHAIRFGAVTGNGEGEKVMGQVMMLKDANSNQVIADVKNRVAEIQSKLPEGVSINPFLERSELIGKTTFTISENLILGCLIVVFVVVLLLGNVRSGLVVASVIPLCLLVALALMHVFGVDANLMSLGAIDFGIIIDGAVIIVEYIAFQIVKSQQQLIGLSKEERNVRMDEITFKSASKMMHSAIFGQLIIVIVFIPILSLSGVEGKMFVPMALVFIFALIGAMILCFTYVPVISALFLKPPKSTKPNFSARFIARLERIYEPLITWALEQKKIIISGAVLLLVSAYILFSSMGGEFVPTLDEGDFVIQPALKTGTTLSNTVDITTKMEKIILKFPQVEQVVSRIGAAEIPTDPMSMEESDVIIKLKPKSEWPISISKDELADQLKEALSVLPQIEVEFTQPIEMRFNELITGVRADLAIKLFGEDLEILNQKAQEIKRKIEHVSGASDIVVEKIAGLPQMTVRYDRQKMAKYGVTVSELNQLVSSGFAGGTAGTVFEGEKRFDLVVRFGEENRNSIEDLENCIVTLPSNAQIPLRELAHISYSEGPAKISRDHTNRRIVVGVNVRGRDLESVVADVQKIIQNQIHLPTGYEITYGGQFENLRSAKARLLIAVPIALVLIFILLYFAFKSVKDALLIYSAIPLSAVGGVWLLWLRDLPFSISAGVGFIALFGIAVLNGIVLIEHFKALESESNLSLNQRIIRGTKERLRPVLLTASAAALGFLPMAISTNAGAEVQRPLATVVVGGLISATFLTLFVLPVLYAFFHRVKPVKQKLSTPTLLVIGIFLSFNSFGQETSAEKMVSLALENNKQIQASLLTYEQQKAHEKQAWNIDKTLIYFNQDQNNLPPVGGALAVWGIQQSFQFPTVYTQQKKGFGIQTELAAIDHERQKRALSEAIHKEWDVYQILSVQLALYSQLDSLFDRHVATTQTQVDLGESNALLVLTAKAKKQYIEAARVQLKQQLENSKMNLQTLVQTPLIFADNESYVPLDFSANFTDTSSLGMAYVLQQKKIALQGAVIAKHQLLPDLHIQYFQGRNGIADAPTYPGIQVGIGVPLFFGTQKATIKIANQQVEKSLLEAENYALNRQLKVDQLQTNLVLLKQQIAQLEQTSLPLIQETKRIASLSLSAGETDFFDYLTSLNQAVELEMHYWQVVHQYNQTVLTLLFLD